MPLLRSLLRRPVNPLEACALHFVFGCCFCFFVDLLFTYNDMFYVLMLIAFVLRSLVSFSVAWKGEQLRDISTALSNSVSYPHIFAHKHISLLNCQGYTVRTLPTTEILPRLLQFTPYSILNWLSLLTLASY